jgi:hypothetical protein
VYLCVSVCVGMCASVCVTVYGKEADDLSHTLQKKSNDAICGNGRNSTILTYFLSYLQRVSNHE